MNSKLRSKDSDMLFDAIALLKTKDEFYNFFEDLCTVPELQSLSHRFKVARLLSEGKTYQETAALCGASTATISRISKCLTYGADGYTLAISRLKENGL